MTYYFGNIIEQIVPYNNASSVNDMVIVSVVKLPEIIYRKDLPKTSCKVLPKKIVKWSMSMESNI